MHILGSIGTKFGRQLELTAPPCVGKPPTFWQQNSAGRRDAIVNRAASCTEPCPMEPVDIRSSPDAKIALFRSLFRGRDDVYPRRFESRRTGKSGYAPACGNEWVAGICEKPRIKCTDCP